MNHHLMPSTPPSTDLSPSRSPSTRSEASPSMLPLDRRLQFAQRLAVLIRRMHTQHQSRAKEEALDES